MYPHEHGQQPSMPPSPSGLGDAYGALAARNTEPDSQAVEAYAPAAPTGYAYGEVVSAGQGYRQVPAAAQAYGQAPGQPYGQAPTPGQAFAQPPAAGPGYGLNPPAAAPHGQGPDYGPGVAAPPPYLVMPTTTPPPRVQSRRTGRRIAAIAATALVVLAGAGAYAADTWAKNDVCNAVKSLGKPHSSSAASASAPTSAEFDEVEAGLNDRARLLFFHPDLKDATHGLADDIASI